MDQLSLLFLWILLLSDKQHYGLGVRVGIVSILKHQIIVLQEMLHYKLLDGSEGVVMKKCGFDCLDLRSDVKGFVDCG